MSQVGRKEGKGMAKAIEACQQLLGPIGTPRRAAEIEALPAVEWKGRPLRTIRCYGVSGKGPHDCNVPLGLLWSLIGLADYLCPYHAGDAWNPTWVRR